MRALFESINLIGDALYVSPALRAWVKKQETVVEVYIHTLNDHTAPLYRGMVEDFLKEDPEDAPRHLKTFALVFDELEGREFDFRWKFDVNEAFKLSDDKKQHLAQSYADLLGVEIPRTRAALKPIFIPEEMTISNEIKGAILISMFSASCTSRDKNRKGLPPNKMLPWNKWKMLLHALRRNFPASPIRILGAPDDEIPAELTVLCNDLGISPMFGIKLNNLALIMREAKFLVTIDNGMSHLAASQECPTFLMYPMCLGTHYILPIGNPNMTYVQMNPVTVKEEYLHQAMEFSIKRLVKEKT